jgi:hypothetical protein
MGPWCYVTVGEKNNKKITFITLYRVCNQNVRTAGSLTATSQQLMTLESARGANSSKKTCIPMEPNPERPHAVPTSKARSQ